MKTMITTNRIQRTVTAIIMLTMVTSMGFGQGLLAEGAAKLLESLLNRDNSTEWVISNAVYSENEAAESEKFILTIHTDDAETEMDQGTRVLLSFNVSHVDVAYENELKTEAWMTETFSSELESNVAVESWMTETFSSELESNVAVESWMTESFSSELESNVAVESWMTESFSSELESNVAVESWMTETFSSELESNVAVESWMTESFSNNLETGIQVEEWMTEPLVSSSLNEKELSIEDWMTALLVK